jgi:hypothetical protein
MSINWDTKPRVWIVVRGNCRSLRFLPSRRDRAGQDAQSLDRPLGRAIEPTLDVDCAGARYNVTYAICKDRVSQDRGGAGAIPHHVAGLLRSLSEHSGPKIFLRILELELFGDGHPVVADDRCTPLLLDQNRFRSWAQCDPYSIGELRCAAQNLLAGR